MFARLLQMVKQQFEDPVTALRKRGVTVGERVAIQSGVMIDYSHGWHVEIGDDVTLAPRVHILAHDACTKKFLNYTKIGKVSIGRRVFIGAGAIVLPGVSIGDDVVIGAGSVVTRDIPASSVAAGNPARVICSLGQLVEKRKKEMQIYPCFGEEYKDENNITDRMKLDMNDAMKDRFGFIV